MVSRVSMQVFIAWRGGTQQGWPHGRGFRYAANLLFVERLANTLEGREARSATGVRAWHGMPGVLRCYCPRSYLSGVLVTLLAVGGISSGDTLVPCKDTLNISPPLVMTKPTTGALAVSVSTEPSAPTFSQ